MKTKILTFIEQVKQEAVKVTWPTQRETITSTIIVFIMAAISSVFFLLVDMASHSGINLLMKIGN